jgi:plastocyanin
VWRLASVIAAMLLHSPLAPAAEPPPAHSAAPSTGSLQGRVTVGEKLWEQHLTFALYPDLHRARAARRAEPTSLDELRNVVVHVTRSGQAPDPALPAGRRAVMSQRDGQFVPHVLPVLVGSDVEFPNDDPIFHNVFSLSRAAEFDLGRYRRGDSRTIRFDQPGVVKVYCHIHSDMSAVVVVLDNPFFAIPDETGRYRIDGMPSGVYEVRAWHERARPIVRTIRILPGEATAVDFTIPLGQAVEDDE